MMHNLETMVSEYYGIHIEIGSTLLWTDSDSDAVEYEGNGTVVMIDEPKGFCVVLRGLGLKLVYFDEIFVVIET